MEQLLSNQLLELIVLLSTKLKLKDSLLDIKNYYKKLKEAIQTDDVHYTIVYSLIISYCIDENVYKYLHYIRYGSNKLIDDKCDSLTKNTNNVLYSQLEWIKSDILKRTEDMLTNSLIDDLYYLKKGHKTIEEYYISHFSNLISLCVFKSVDIKDIIKNIRKELLEIE